jgi:RNA polymerase sigma factor FliA
MPPKSASPFRVRPVETGPAKCEFTGRPVNELFEEYRRTKSNRLRNYLWETFRYLVRYTAERIYSRLPDEVDVNDLVQAGQFGLMEALDKFEPQYGVKFETFCAQRINGAIIDELRAMDPVPRLVRSRTARVVHAVDQFKMKNGRPPTADEIAESLGVAGEEREKIERDGKPALTVSLSRKAFNSDGNKEVTEIDVIRDESQSDPMQDTQRRDVKEIITKGLSRAERLIVVLYYYEEMTMKEIGATLDLSESRVSQMHSQILARLKSQMQFRTRELEEATN